MRDIQSADGGRIPELTLGNSAPALTLRKRGDRYVVSTALQPAPVAAFELAYGWAQR